MKKLLKGLTFTLALTLSLVLTIFFGCSNENQQKKNKKIYKYSYKMGTLAEKGYLYSEIKYNDNGKKEEDIEYNSDSSLEKKTIYRYNEKEKFIEKAEYKGTDLQYKKIITYNKNDKKELVQIYQSWYDFNLHKTTSPLRGAVKIYYDKTGKVSEKKWIGDISQDEEEVGCLILYGAIIDHATGELAPEDSSVAKYYYNENGKIKKTEIDMKGVRRTVFVSDGKLPQYLDDYCIYYYYNDLGGLVKKEIYESGYKSTIIEYLFNDSLLTQVKESNIEVANIFHSSGTLGIDGVVYRIYIANYDNKKNIKEESQYGKNLTELIWRKKYKYNTNNDPIEIIEYNSVNEPIELSKIEYKYQ